MILFLEILAVLILLMVIVLSVPIHLGLKLSDTGTTFNLRIIHWFLFSLYKSSDEPRKEKSKKKSEEKVESETTGKAKEEEEDNFPWFSFLVSERSFVLDIIRHLLRALNRLFHIPRWELIRFHWQIGGDPAVIGMLTGLCWSILPFVPNRLDFSFEPDFIEGISKWELELKVSIVPLFVIGWLILELIRFPWFRSYIWWRHKRRFYTDVSPKIA